MPIKGLTDRVKLERNERGSAVRLGYLQKGRREGFGKGIKLYDENHFIFSPLDGGRQGNRMREIFRRTYDEKPYEIPDVRLPVDIAGNFNIEDCAWLVARKHTKRGSHFLARGDGENIKQARNPETGRAEFFYDGERPFSDCTKKDGDDVCYVYKGKLYPFQQEMIIDLILPDFNKALAAAGVAGHGVVTLITHATYDIANLISEYNSMLDEIAGLISNPTRPGDFDRARRWLPWRNFPIRLYRSEDKITTPNWKTGDKGDRMHSTRWLVHWQLNPDFATAMYEAIDQRTKKTLALVANRPLLETGNPVEDANAALFGDEPEPVAIPAQAESSVGPDWDDIPFEDIEDEPEIEDGEIEDAEAEFESLEQLESDPRSKPAASNNAEKNSHTAASFGEWYLEHGEQRDYYHRQESIKGRKAHVFGTLKKLFGENVGISFRTRSVEDYERALDQYAIDSKMKAVG